MKRRSMFLIVVCLGISILPAAACDLHSGPMFGAYAFQHSYMQPANRADEPAQLTIEHDRFASAVINQPQVISIDYELPYNFQEVTLRFSSTDGVEFMNTGDVPLVKKKGRYALSYTAKAAGEYVINVEAEAVRDGMPYLHVQKIQLTAL